VETIALPWDEVLIEAVDRHKQGKADREQRQRA
jgi:hypothetical protein